MKQQFIGELNPENSPSVKKIMEFVDSKGIDWIKCNSKCNVERLESMIYTHAFKFGEKERMHILALLNSVYAIGFYEALHGPLEGI